MCIDPEHFRQVTGDDPEFALELLDAFLEDSSARVAQMRAGVAQQDLKLVQRAAHQIKGSSSNVGAFAIQQLAKAIEQNAGDWQAVAQMLEEINTLLAQVATFREQFLQK